MKTFTNQNTNHSLRRRLFRNRRRSINRQLNAALKRERGCDLCGRRDLPLRDLHWDHIKGEKKMKVCHMISTSPEALKVEVSKCQLICAESHWRRHRTGELTLCKSAKVAAILNDGGDHAL